MLTFLYIVLVISILGYFIPSIIFRLANLKKPSSKLPEQLKAYRWIYSVTYALSLASLFTLAVIQFAHLSDIYLYIIWGVLFIVFFIGFYIYAKYTITEWFGPNKKLPQLPARFTMRDKRGILIIILSTIVFILILFPDKN